MIEQKSELLLRISWGCFAKTTKILNTTSVSIYKIFFVKIFVQFYKIIFKLQGILLTKNSKVY
jgi:hypothetical protein